jgi:oxygen-independent coproporphyrinogen III oxidase
MPSASRLRPGDVTPELIARLDRQGPRYTSYPTAPEWTDAFGPEDFVAAIRRADERDEPLAVYVHVPFCRELCFFCGCTVVIDNKPATAQRYLERLRREIALVVPHLRRRRRVGQLHLGGGTPTHLTPRELEDLHALIAAELSFDRDAELSIEVDPRVTSGEHVATLRRLGFNRISLGVQDFDLAVQKAVNREQSEEATRSLFETCRLAGFSSINVDLIYGLPHQTPESFSRTLESVLRMRPDRIAVFGYAHVPWMKPAQRKLEKEEGLPSPQQRCALFATAIETFNSAGYRHIGMDHFALPEDELSRALDEGTMTRSFQGYTTRPAADLLSFGHSSISDLAGAYAQNARHLPDYERAIDEGGLATQRGYWMSSDDELRRAVIVRVMSASELDFGEIEKRFDVDFRGTFARELGELATLCELGLATLEPDRLRITPVGRVFVRNLAMVFDRFLRERPPAERRFSRTV